VSIDKHHVDVSRAAGTHRNVTEGSADHHEPNAGTLGKARKGTEGRRMPNAAQPTARLWPVPIRMVRRVQQEIHPRSVATEAGEA
jgi:hypothetical protein